MGTFGIVEGLLFALVVLYGIRRFWIELILPGMKFIKKAVHVTDIMVSIPERLDELEKRTKQLTPNGGSHLSDDIRATRVLLEEHVVDAMTWKTNISHRLMTLEDRDYRNALADRREDRANKRDDMADIREHLADERENRNP